MPAKHYLYSAISRLIKERKQEEITINFLETERRNKATVPPEKDIMIEVITR